MFNIITKEDSKMISFDTYITLLFAIIIPAIGIFITITISNFSYYKKRDSLLILLFSSFMLLIIATLLYCLKRYLYASDLLPFTKPQFSEPLFYTKYKTYFFLSIGFSLGICVNIFINCGNIRDNGYGIVIFNIKYAIITTFFYLFIIIYAHLWFIYGLCYFSFNIIVDIIISFIIMGIEFGILYHFNTYLTFRKISKEKNTY